ncbi:MAG: hypothetical protein Ta2F_15420 [Termitinemataceae bacterium]|nr:MAG: hypothetical protein Ta2F_15420 [Termitinemataceae bacterium]
MNAFCSRWTVFGIVLAYILLFSSCGEAKPDIGAWIDEQLAKARESDGEGDPSGSNQIVILGTDITAAELITITIIGNYYYVEFSRADGSPCSDSRLDKTDVPIDYKTILDGISGNVAVEIVGDSGNVETPFKLQLKDVDLAVNRVVSGEPLPAIRLKGDNSGIYPNVELIIEGTNSAVSNGVSSDGDRTHAGIFVPKGSKINIHGIDGDVSANKLTAKANVSSYYYNGAGIGGCRDPIENTAMAGSITIGSGVTIEAHGGRGSAGIGGGYDYDGGSEKIKIEGNAVVYAYGIWGGPGIGIGKNASTPSSHTTVIEIAGEAYVYASGSSGESFEGAGIGVGTSISLSRLNAEIKIGGNAYVFAQGGSDAAGIGTGYTSDYYTTRNLTLTIGNGSDNPVVAAIATSSLSISICPAIGYVGDAGSLNEPNDINITINSGFVIAESVGSTQIIGSRAVGPNLNLTTKITGGSVWVNNFNPDCINPPARNAGGNPIYPLYLPSVYDGTDFWLGTGAKEVTVPLANYKAKTSDAKVKAFIDSLFGGSIPAGALDIAAVLWVPPQLYTDNISVGGIAASADVTSSCVEYSSTLTTNVINMIR